MIDTLFNQPPPRRIWLIADLQQSMPELIEECLRIAVDDLLQLGARPDAVWYLGDATEGRNPAVVEQSVAIQLELLARLQAPVRFIMGNHDLDCTRDLQPPCAPVLPMWTAARNHPDWTTTESCDQWFFIEHLGPWMIVFLSDHVAQDRSWLANQHTIAQAVPGSYPHPRQAFTKLRDQMAEHPGPVIIAGHYAFPGGTRGGPPDGILTRLLPLPPQVGLILHGHAHLGDFAYGHQQCYRRISYVDYHDLTQVNISSLDRTRGSQVRSAFLDLYDDGTLILFFRDHEDQRFSDVLIRDTRAPRSLTDRHRSHHTRKTKDLPDWLKNRIAPTSMT